ncbi:MAG: triose-phosphate isomerase [Acidobacteria bacterium]|nr:triose-phosphate isomerase [Acidobacteriota bacterium]MCI0621229.1 triose-phosphate isomerase [Acidobacteriota bacterium]MCI0718099.1 triose-phosphate isomerase [Acidobacteriota bacterium]
MRRPVIAGNWKLYKTVKETVQFVEQLKPLVQNSSHCDIVIAPPFTALSAAIHAAAGTNILVSGQDLFWEKEGAFTGEVSAPMLADLGCQFCIVGHSERRQYFGETNETVNRKTQAALAAGLTPIVCIGETLAEREVNQTHTVIQTQFDEGFNNLTVQDFFRIVVAYEPVWAIGTGRTATPEMAVEVHKQIRQFAQQKFGSEASRELRILYGGSVKPNNIKGLMAQVDIDGALVGGASLKADSFASMVNF